MSASPADPKPESPKAPESVSAPRKETILARYPRKLKLAALAVILAAILTPFFMSGTAEMAAKAKKEHMPSIQGEESEASRANDAPKSAENGTISPSSAGGDVALNEQDDQSIKMSPAPENGLSEDTPEGSLPRIAEDGRQPWQVYARPFNTADRRPRIAIVVTDLGLSRVATDAAINHLPANVTLAFDTQSPVVGAWCGRARQDGHETLLMIPMEPFDYPRSDPGANTLLTSLPNADNLRRFYNALRAATGYVGVTTLSGSRFTTDPDKLTPVLDVLHKRGLMIFDARVAPHSAIMDMARNMHVPAVIGTTRLDQNPSPEAIDMALDQLEKTARLTGHAVGVTAPLPVVVDRLQIWLKDLPRRGIALAPISAMVQ